MSRVPKPQADEGSPKVAALFVAENGCYSGVGCVDAWPEDRDARTYQGSLPVIAHPPCQLWVNMAGVNFKRHGGAHNRPGNDQGCFNAALGAVMRCGGVLEHPAGSFAWPTFGIDRPGGDGWSRSYSGGQEYWVCEVWQSAYGHKARKRTWLLYRGDAAPSEMCWDRKAGTHQVGWFDRIKPTLSKREAMATPHKFRDALIDLAIKSKCITEDE